MAASEQYSFGAFTLDVGERRLSTGGHAVGLAPKAYDVLVALVRKAGRLVTKRELLELVWPDCFVEEGILAVHVSALRKVLDAGAEGHPHIETVARLGYRFTAAVSEPDPMPDSQAGQSSMAALRAQPIDSETSGVRSRGTLRPPTRIEVYELFGRGRSHLLSASMFEVPKAAAAFRAALELDPTYAAAHAGLALACCALATYRLAPAAEVYSDARASALRALAMDPSCADAQVALGTVLFLSEWNWTGAERSLERAIELNPNHTEAYLVHGQLMEALGRLDKGLEMKQRALERDPFSPLVHLQISISFWHQRRYDDAIEWANRALELDPRHPHAREHLAGAYLKKGDLDRYMAENIKHAEVHGVAAEALEPLKRAYTSSGHAGVIHFVLERASSQPSAFPSFQLAVLNGDAGNLDEAFRHLERAIESHDPALVHLAVAPQWDSLRGDPRFNQCLTAMGLSPCTPSQSS